MPNANEINKEALLPIVMKRSAHIFETICLNLETPLRRIINSPHRKTALRIVKSNFSSLSHNRLFVRHQLWAQQLRITLSTILSKALCLSLHNIDVHWAMIAHEIKEEFTLELEGPPALWADDVMQAWSRREASLRNHGRAIMHSVASLIEDAKISVHFQIQRRKGCNQQHQ